MKPFVLPPLEVKVLQQVSCYGTADVCLNVRGMNCGVKEFV